MKNRAIKIREKYEKKLAKAISKSGGITLINNLREITAVTVAEAKGLYAIDFDYELIAIEKIMQEVSTGKIFAFNQEFGMMDFDFKFVGSKEECQKYLLEKKESVILEVAELHVIINGSN